MTLALITDHEKHAAFLRELRERCLAEGLNNMIAEGLNGTEPVAPADVVERHWDAMVATGWKVT